MAGTEVGGAAPDGLQSQSLGVGPESLGTAIEQRPLKHGGQALVQDVVVEVEISSHYAMINNHQAGFGQSAPNANRLDKARMTISPWDMEHQRYFTLTFTSFADSLPNLIPAHARHMSELERQRASPETSASIPSSTNSVLGDHHRDSSKAKTDSSIMSAPLIALASDLSGLDKSHIKAHLPLLETVHRIKDAMIDSMEIPAIAMSQDESLAIVNKAAMALLQQKAGSASSAPANLLTTFKVYTEDFARELETEEQPIFKICKSRKPFDRLKVGILDSNSQRKRFDVRGETIYDKETGEFLAGMIFMKDMTEYAEIITNQLQAGQHQFQLVCDTIPQMVRLI